MRRSFTIIALTTALAALWGCSNPNDSGTAGDDLVNREQHVDFDDPYGGYNFGDEIPNFGDAMLATDYGPDATAEVDDPMTDDAVVSDVLSDRTRARRFLMITWGNLEADSTINFVTDWSGSLTVDNGVVILRRTIRFDPFDEILPRTSSDKLEWISRTRPHFDGILVELHKVVMRGDTLLGTVDALDSEPLSVTFATGPLTVTIPQEELQDLHRIVKVDDAGNAVAFNTIVVMPDECPSGFLGGQWKNVDNRPGGKFRGKWISHNGVHMGYLRGVYGHNSRGEKVFFGKWITEAGRFKGLLKGHYGNFETEDHPGGWFRGVWITRNLRAEGALGGVWHTSDHIDGGGYFRGEWKAHCR